MKKLIVASLFMLLSFLAAQAQVSSNGCDQSLWARVYSHYRFSYPGNDPSKGEPLHRCVQIRGRLDHITPISDEGDGDIHLSLVPDNKGVLKSGQKFLMVEIVCADNTPGIGPAKVTCKDYHIPAHLSYARVRQFKKGQHVQIIGELVVDYGHWRTGLAEIHPVSRLDPIP